MTYNSLLKKNIIIKAIKYEYLIQSPIVMYHMICDYLQIKENQRISNEEILFIMSQDSQQGTSIGKKIDPASKKKQKKKKKKNIY